MRSQPAWNKQFPYAARQKAQVYLADIGAKGRRVTLIQLETSFELRVRRLGLKDQFFTFDSSKKAEQARLKLESDLSVSIVRDYAMSPS